jgi:hypothetical protein
MNHRLPVNPLREDLANRGRWDSSAKSRGEKYRRLIGISKRLSIMLGKRCPGAVPLLFVLGYPKSGTTWMCQLLADYFRIPFPQYAIFPLGFPAVLHSFEKPSSSYRSGVYMLRDGRDALVSSYFHVRGLMLGGSPAAYYRKLFAGLDPQAPARENLETYFERFLKYPTGGWTKLPHWGEHVRSFLSLKPGSLVGVKYEELLFDGPATLGGAIEQLVGSVANSERIAEALRRCSFESQSGRKQGEESRDSYFRKGEAGDWKNHFSPTMAKLFAEQFGDVLIAAGYEPDSSWAKQV